MSLRSANRGAAVVVAIILAVTPVLQALPQTPPPPATPRRQAKPAPAGQSARRQPRRQPAVDRRLAARLHDAEPGSRRSCTSRRSRAGPTRSSWWRSRRRRIRPKARRRRPNRRSARIKLEADDAASRSTSGWSTSPTCGSPSRISRRCPRSNCARSSPRSRRRFPKRIASLRSIACWRSSTRAPSCRRTCRGSRPIRRRSSSAARPRSS